MSTQLDLADPATFTSGPPHEALTELRRTRPVLWQDMAGEPGFFAVLRHADVLAVIASAVALLGEPRRHHAGGSAA